MSVCVCHDTEDNIFTVPEIMLSWKWTCDMIYVFIKIQYKPIGPKAYCEGNNNCDQKVVW